MQQLYLPRVFIDVASGMLLYYEGDFCKFERGVLLIENIRIHIIIISSYSRLHYIEVISDAFNRKIGCWTCDKIYN